ncbi:unnamed protein product [Discula destructiva]
MASQNMYDNDAFFEKYSEFPRAIRGEKGASEWPELQSMLPSDLRGRRVLDLACGEGWFSRWCIARGAREVDACDLSVNMLRKAEGRTRTAKSEADKCSAAAGAVVEGVANNNNNNSSSSSSSSSSSGSINTNTKTNTNSGSDREDPRINYARVDLEKLQLRPGAYELVFCGLALHYVRNISNCIAQVHGSLVPGGLFVFSIEHPFLTAPTRPGFTKTADGEVDQWPVDSYFDEGERSVHWIVKDVKKQHRTMSSYFTLLVAAGFEVVKMDEWGAAEERTRKHPDWVEGVCPRFLMIMARRKSEPEKKRSSGTRAIR